MIYSRILGVEFYGYFETPVTTFSTYDTLNLRMIKFYYTDIYVLSILKCKKKFWKINGRNVLDLVYALNEKIGFDIYNALSNASSLQCYLHLRAPFDLEYALKYDISKSYISFDLNEDFFNAGKYLLLSSDKERLYHLSYYSKLLEKYFQLYFDSYTKLRDSKITPENLAFGNFSDKLKRIFKV
jgi:hypothetical protein